MGTFDTSAESIYETRGYWSRANEIAPLSPASNQGGRTRPGSIESYSWQLAFHQTAFLPDGIGQRNDHTSTGTGTFANLNEAFATSSQPAATEKPQEGVYTCNRPIAGDLSEDPGNTHNGPDIDINPFTHEYPCVVRDDNAHCSGQTGNGDLYGPGYPTTDDQFDPRNCELVSTDPCVMDNMDQTMSDPSRPGYGVYGPGTNCQEWTGDSIEQARNDCDDNSEDEDNDSSGSVEGGFHCDIETA